MLKTRVIPSLLIKNSGLVKTVGFKDPKYVGDPINAIKIFNDKEVDELVVIDIEATKRGSIDYSLLSRLNKEAFMPLAYGGGIKNIDDVKKILQLGYEKIIINSAALQNPKFISECAVACGSQSVVICIDSVHSLLGAYHVYDYLTRKKTKLNIEDWAKKVEELGAGEILLYSVNNEGSYSGYDLKLIKQVANSVRIPIVALGGARNVQDLRIAVKEGGASAVAAGSMFVFHGPHKAVLITYPNKKELRNLFE